MLQPFVKFKLELIDRLMGINKKYLVSQAYKRGYDHLAKVHKIDLLFTDYDDVGLATIHYDAVKKDKYASLIHLSEPKHRAKVEEILKPESNYEVYWAVVSDREKLKKTLDHNYKWNVKNYISKHTKWRVGSNEVVTTNVKVIFGEIFMTIKRGSETLQVKFEEIEKA